MIQDRLVDGGFVAPADRSLYRVTDSCEDAATEIDRFYANYHSIRYVGDNLVLRLQHVPDRRPARRAERALRPPRRPRPDRAGQAVRHRAPPRRPRRAAADPLRVPRPPQRRPAGADRRRQRARPGRSAGTVTSDRAASECFVRVAPASTPMQATLRWGWGERSGPASVGVTSRLAGMPVLGPEHDLAHPVEGDSAWSESYYFNCYDPDADCGFYTRVGVRPNEGTIDVGLALWVPGRRARRPRSPPRAARDGRAPPGGRPGHVRADRADAAVAADVRRRVAPPRATWRWTSRSTP